MRLQSCDLKPFTVHDATAIFRIRRSLLAAAMQDGVISHARFRAEMDELRADLSRAVGALGAAAGRSRNVG